MIYYDVDPVAEVRRNREILLEKHGGIDGLHKHMDEEQPILKQQGWKFISVEEVLMQRRSKTRAETK